MKKRPRRKPDPEPDPDQNPDPDDLFSLAASKAARDEGMERVLSSEEWWRANAYRLLEEQPPEIGEPFLAEEFWAYALPLIGQPHDYHALGALWGGAIRQGLVVAIGRKRRCRKLSNHANKRDLYRWPQPPGAEVDFE